MYRELYNYNNDIMESKQIIQTLQTKNYRIQYKKQKFDSYLINWEEKARYDAREI